MAKYKRKHKVVSIRNGFKIIPRTKIVPEVSAVCNSYGFWHITSPSIDPNKYCYLNLKGIPLYAFGRVLDLCVDVMYIDWAPVKKGRDPSYVPVAVSNWARKKTASALNSRTHVYWEKACKKVGSEINSLHKKLYAVAGGAGDWDSVEEALNSGDEYLLEDAMNYRAARISLLGDGCKLWKADWRLSYAHNDKINGSLRRTLMNLPYGVAYFDALNLKTVTLPEPIFSRLKLLAYTMVSRRSDEETTSRKVKVLLRSTEEDIKRAILYMWRYFPNSKTGDFRRLKQIRNALQLIFDYGEPIGEWDIMGLAKRSEKFHHDADAMARAARAENARLFAVDNEAYAKLIASDTRKPPIALPTNPNITFLDTYNSVVHEGELMRHCVAQYAKSAVEGKSYLFHTEYKGEMATTEVHPLGFVVQSYGQRDSINNASKYASRTLSQWCKKLKTTSSSKKSVGQQITGAPVPF